MIAFAPLLVTLRPYDGRSGAGAGVGSVGVGQYRVVGRRAVVRPMVGHTELAWGER